MQNGTGTGSKGGAMRFISKLIVVCVIAAFAAPYAAAEGRTPSPEGGPWPTEGRPIGWDGAPLRAGSGVRLTGDSGGQLPPQPISSTTVSAAPSVGGFDWVDAAIGAGFATTVLFLAGGLRLVVRSRQERVVVA
jgi:hypothetical protein